MQLDPGLKSLVLRRTGSRLIEAVTGAGAKWPAPVMARLVPHQNIPGLTVTARFGDVVTGRVPLDRLAEVRNDARVLSLKAAQPLGPQWAESLPDLGIGPSERQTNLPTGRGVVVAAIDWGFDFVHDNFRRTDGGTRLLALWDQRSDPNSNSPIPFGYGREFSRAEIDAALGKPDPYSALGYDPENADEDGGGAHGTHVMDIAAGNGRAPGARAGMASESDLLFVHLGGRDTRPEDTMGDSVHLLEALRWIAERSQGLPLVINISAGQHGGPHDGSTLVELALDSFLSEAPGRAVVMSTGNYHDARVHTAGRLSTGLSNDIPWEVPARNEIAELEIWYPGGDDIECRLTDPGGRIQAAAAPGEDVVIENAGGQVIGALYHRRRDPNNCDNQIDILLWPDAPAGTWHVQLIGKRIVDGRYHGWIERALPGSQSRFDFPAVVSTGTTNTICNGRLTIAVGAHGGQANAAAILPFSSVGPTRDGRNKPDLTAPGGGILAARSSRTIAGGRSHNEFVRKSGTSMAAPHVTGAIALIFEAASRRLSVPEIRAVLLATTANPTLTDAVGRHGAGCLDVRRALAVVAALVPSFPLLPSIRAPELKEIPMQTLIEHIHDLSSPESCEWTSDGDDACLDSSSGADRCLDWLARPARSTQVRPQEVWSPSHAQPMMSSLAEAVRYQRKATSGLTTSEGLRFFNAVAILMINNEAERNASGTPLHRWGKLPNMHEDLGSRIHGTIGNDWPGRSQSPPRPPASGHVAFAPLMQFLPWHRMFCLWFEQELKRIDPGVSLPYWDWTRDRTLPNVISSLRPRLTTPRGRVDVTRDKTTETSGASRGLDDFVNLPGQADIDALMLIPDYETFTLHLEGHHNRGHVWIGGSMGSTDTAPADPMFFLHHAQIDRIWRMWQRRHPGVAHPQPSARIPYRSGEGPIQVGTRSLVTVADVMNVEDLEYDYA